MMPDCTLPSVRRGPRAAAALAGTPRAGPSGAAAALACTPRDIMSRAAAAPAGMSRAGPSGAAAAPACTSPAIASRVVAAPAIRSQSVAAPAARPADPAVASWPALGTVAALAVTDPMLLPAARELLAAEIAAVDAACSSFREDSELAAVNAATCLQARAASIAAMIRGNDAIGWLAGRGLAARLVEAGGRVRTVASWPADPAGTAGTVDPAGLPGIAGQSPLPGMIAATFAASGTENSPRSRNARLSYLAGTGGATVPR